MAGDLKKFKQGERVRRFPAETWNALVDGELRDRAAGAAQPPNWEAATHQLSPCEVQVRNDTGGHLASGRAVKLGAVLVEPGNHASAAFESPIFAGETPLGADGEQVAILAEPLGKNAVGVARIMGAAWAKVDVTSASDAYAATQAGTLLASAASGPIPIVWKQSGTGEQWAVVQLGAGAGSTIVTGWLIDEIPAESALADAVTLETWNGVWYTGVEDPADPPNLLKYYGINRSKNIIRGDATVKIPIWGQLRSLTLSSGEGGPAVVQAVEILATFDIASVFSFVQGNRQVLYHEPGERNQRLDGGPCTTG